MTSYRFGPHELDLGRYELRTDGTRVKIDPKAFDALCVLAERADNLVTKDELLQQLWPGETVVEGAVHSTIARARRALGQRGSSDGPIATVHGRGYRFVAPLERMGDPPMPTRLNIEPPPETDPFVGRKVALNLLVSRLGTPEPGLWWIEGDAGIGKTRLCEQLSRVAAEHGIQTLWGRCLESASNPTFWPFRRLHQAASQAAPGMLTALPAPWREELSRLGPSADEPADSPETPVDGTEAGRFRLYEAVAAMLAETARRGVGVFVIDDVHWADEPSLALIEFLASEQAGAPWMVLVTYRAGELGRDSTVERTRQRVSRQRGAHMLQLSGLDEDEVTEWATQSGAKLADREVARALCVKTGGNPLFLSESLRTMPAQGTPIDLAVVRDLRVPEGVRGLLRRRLEALPESTRKVLRQASVLGRDLDPAALARALNWSVHDIREALLPGVEARVLRESGADAVHFDHDLWQGILYTELTDRERTHAHLLAAQTLERDPLGAEARCHELAHHYLEAMPAAPAAATVYWCQKAADSATRSHGYEEAARLLGRALNALRYSDDVDPNLVADLQLARGKALERAGRSEEAWQQLAAVVETARARGDVVRMAHAALGLRGLHILAISDERLRLVLSEVESKLPREESLLRARVSARLAMQAPLAISMEQRAERAALAMELAGDCDDEATLVDVYSARLQSLQGPHQLCELEQACNETAKLAQERGLDGLLADVHVARYLARLLNCDRPGALRALDDFGRLADRLRQPIYQWHHQRAMAYHIMKDGRFDEAKNAFRSLHRSGQRLHPWMLHFFHRVQTNSMIRYTEDMSLFSKVDVDDLLTRFSWAGANLRAACMLFYAETGRTQTAREGFESLAAFNFEDVPRCLEYVAMLGNLTELAVRFGDTPRTERLVELLTPHAAVNSVNALGLYDGVGAFYLGLATASLGRGEEAANWWKQALELHQHLRNTPYVARTQVELATLYAKRGDTTDARHWADQARPTLTALSLKPLGARLKRLDLA